ncbi:MAG: hypothetical protein KDA41_14985, partial [Planctomycetales bacterium]|nr:hypothetical protein [Planctomycetales bacterium]
MADAFRLAPDTSEPAPAANDTTLNATDDDARTAPAADAEDAKAAKLAERDRALNALSWVRDAINTLAAQDGSVWLHSLAPAETPGYAAAYCQSRDAAFSVDATTDRVRLAWHDGRDVWLPADGVADDAPGWLKHEPESSAIKTICEAALGCVVARRENLEPPRPEIQAVIAAAGRAFPNTAGSYPESHLAGIAWARLHLLPRLNRGVHGPYAGPWRVGGLEITVQPPQAPSEPFALVTRYAYARTKAIADHERFEFTLDEDPDGYGIMLRAHADRAAPGWEDSASALAHWLRSALVAAGYVYPLVTAENAIHANASAVGWTIHANAAGNVVGLEFNAAAGGEYTLALSGERDAEADGKAIADRLGELAQLVDPRGVLLQELEQGFSWRAIQPRREQWGGRTSIAGPHGSLAVVQTYGGDRWRFRADDDSDEAVAIPMHYGPQAAAAAFAATLGKSLA